MILKYKTFSYLKIEGKLLNLIKNITKAPELTYLLVKH